MGLRIKNRQFSLRSILLATAFISAVLALFVASNQFVKFVAVSVIAANALGLLAGFFVTHVFRFPRDGNYRHTNDETSD